MRSIVHSIIIVLLFSNYAFAKTKISSKIIDDSLVRMFVVNTFEHANLELAEGAKNKRLPFNVRVLIAWDNRKIAGYPKCSETSVPAWVYINAGVYDENPEEAVYRLSMTCKWQFRRWVKFPDEQKDYAKIKNNYAVFELAYQNYGEDPQLLEISVNPWSIKIKELGPTDWKSNVREVK